MKQYGFVKRLEHFWKGLSDNRSQISPIPPQAYGDRFINFVTGITMTKEEAERRQTHETTRSEPISTVIARSRQNSRSQQVGVGQALTTGMDGRDREKSPPGSPIAVERTMQKAQKQVNKETNTDKGRKGSEDEKPTRTLLTAEDSDRVLPVVSEENLSEEKTRDSSRHESGNRGDGIRIVSASTRRDSGEDYRDHDEEEVKREKPPRLDSTLLPSVSPIEEMGGAFGGMNGDPEKR